MRIARVAKNVIRDVRFTEAWIFFICVREGAKNKNRMTPDTWVLREGNFNTHVKATIDGSLFAVRTSPGRAERYWSCVGKSIYFIQWRKKGLKGGWIELPPEKGPLSLWKRLFFNPSFYDFRYAIGMDTFIVLSVTSTNCQFAKSFANAPSVIWIAWHIGVWVILIFYPIFILYFPHN